MGFTIKTNIMSRRQRKVRAVIGLAGLAAGLGLTACSSSTPNTNTTEHNQAAAGINLLLTNQPVPIFPTSALRGNLTEVEAIQALGSPTTSFFFPEGTIVVNGKFTAPPFKICASQGEPVHATDQLSNPGQVVGSGGPDGVVVGQMDPNGIYAGVSSGTYVLCVTPGGSTKMAYWEGPVETESGAAVWNPNGGPGQQIQDVGPSQLPICTLVHAAPGDGTNLKTGTPYYHCVKA